MRTAALTFILMLLSQGCSAQTDLYLIALMGQSNMEGRGELSLIPCAREATKISDLRNPGSIGLLLGSGVADARPRPGALIDLTGVSGSTPARTIIRSPFAALGRPRLEYFDRARWSSLHTQSTGKARAPCFGSKVESERR